MSERTCVCKNCYFKETYKETIYDDLVSYEINHFVCHLRPKAIETSPDNFCGEWKPLDHDPSKNTWIKLGNQIIANSKKEKMS